MTQENSTHGVIAGSSGEKPNGPDRTVPNFRKIAGLDMMFPLSQLPDASSTILMLLMSADEEEEEEKLSRHVSLTATKIESLSEIKEITGQEVKVENLVVSASSTDNEENISSATTEESPLTLAHVIASNCPSLEFKFNDSTTKIFDDAGSCVSSAGDICRICHMGGFPAVMGYRPMWEWPDRGARRQDSEISTLSSYAYLGPLISACKCRGSVGLVHTECLERWLTESGHTRCELCGHRFSIKRVPRHGIFRSIAIWFNTVIATRQMLLDILYLVATTPLALFSCYVCALALKMIVESGFQDIPWMIVAMLPTCSLTLVAYWGWLITLGRYITRLHGRRWHRFWRNNFVVRLIPENTNFLHRQDDGSDAVRERMEYRSTRHINYEDSDMLFDRLTPDEELQDFLQII